jgi:PAS domain S-box-containing protein
MDSMNPLMPLQEKFGLWVLGGLFYVSVLVAITSYVSIQMLVRSRQIYRRQSVALLLTLSLPWLAFAVYALEPGLLPVSLAPLVSAIAGTLFLMVNPSRLQVLDVVPVAHRVIIDGMSDPIFVLNEQGRIMQLNPAAQQLISSPAEGSIGKQMEAVLPQWSAFAEVPQKEQKEIRELVIGDDAYDARSSQIVDWRGRLTSQIWVLRNITERKRMDRELRQSEERYRLIAENMTETVWLMDMNLKPTYISPSAVPLRGYTLEELYALPLDRQLTPDSLKLAWETFKEALSEENMNSKDAPTSITLELEFYRKDGSTFWNESTFSLVRNSKGEPAGILGVGREITERKRMEEKLRQYSSNLEQLVFERTAKLTENERRFRELSDLLPQIVFEIDENGNVQYMNRAGFAATGLSEEEFSRGLNAFHFLAPAEHDRATRGIQRVMAGEMIGEREFTVPRRDGTSFPALVYTAPITRGGKAVGLRGIAIDITQRKRTEEKVRAASLYARNLIEASLDPLVTISPDGKITDVNKATELVTGFSRDQLIGSDFSDYFTDPEKARRGYEEAFAKGFVKDYGLAIRDKSGKVTDVLYHATVYRDETGEVQGVFAAARDITERKRMEARLAESQRLAAIGETTAMVGHDLRNPLQGIVSTVYLAKKKLESPLEFAVKCALVYMLETIENEAEYMDKIVSDLQDYAAPLKAEPKPVEMEPLVKDTLSKMRIPRNVKVSFKVSEPLPSLMIDPTVMRRVFSNLIMNAIQAMPDGGELTIDLSRREEHLLVSFRDTGVGIPEEKVDKLFNPFFTTKAKGQGLGLAVCKRLVEACGGRITVESKLGEGSTFTVELPFIKP